jgi:hypothetical protein
MGSPTARSAGYEKVSFCPFSLFEDELHLGISLNLKNEASHVLSEHSFPLLYELIQHVADYVLQ